MKNIITAVSVALILGLACPVISSANEEENEKSLKMSDVPAAVQKAAQDEAREGASLLTKVEMPEPLSTMR